MVNSAPTARLLGMACTFGDQLLRSYRLAVSAARLSDSTPKKHALADVALMSLLTHEKECRSCQRTGSQAAPSSGVLPFFSIGLQS